ncbi:hypothetical protein GCM10011357_15560 [Lacimicrobium alkaliphilum]|uniref:Uncharacterized protein n=1 Tax=Lacimicrobium alkaliphilum TaxID=1526571 RepID=A0ABQ1RB50_9ALTE|nr:hypothetical protein GCM10011357_15560 [Lacimicrobium alkaliphilum]
MPATAPVTNIIAASGSKSLTNSITELFVELSDWCTLIYIMYTIKSNCTQWVVDDLVQALFNRRNTL